MATKRKAVTPTVDAVLVMDALVGLDGEFALNPPLCPNCQNEPKGIVQRLTLALLATRSDGSYDWDGTTDVWWEDCRNVKRNGRVLVRCTNLHFYYATMTRGGKSK